MIFRLSSYPAPEPLPHVAHPLGLHEGSRFIETRVVLVDDMPTLVCIPRGTSLSLAALSNNLKAIVVDGSAADLPPPFTKASAPVPPLGKLFGVPVIVDEAVLAYAVIAFSTFSELDIVEVPYDDFSRLEQPRAEKVAFGGELPPNAP